MKVVTGGQSEDKIQEQSPRQLRRLQGSHIRKNGYRAARIQNRIKVRRDRWVTLMIVQLGSMSSQGFI